MANAILNFHFDFLTPSLRIIQLGTIQSSTNQSLFLEVLVPNAPKQFPFLSQMHENLQNYLKQPEPDYGEVADPALFTTKGGTAVVNS